MEPVLSHSLIIVSKTTEKRYPPLCSRWLNLSENQLICALRKKCPSTAFFLVRVFLYSDWIQENTDQKKLRIYTLFTQCWGYNFEWLMIASKKEYIIHEPVYDKTLDSPSVLISFSYTRNKKKNLSTRKVKLTRVTNSQEVTHKTWMAR